MELRWSFWIFKIWQPQTWIQILDTGRIMWECHINDVIYVYVIIYVMRNRAEQGCMENEFNGGQRICLDDSDIFWHIPTYSDIFILTVGNRFKDRHQLLPEGTLKVLFRLRLDTRTSMAWSAQVFTWSLRCSDGTNFARAGDRRIGTIGTQLQQQNEWLLELSVAREWVMSDEQQVPEADVFGPSAPASTSCQ